MKKWEHKNKENDKSKKESEATLKAIIKLDKPKNLGKSVIKTKNMTLEELRVNKLEFVFNDFRT